MDLLEAMYTKSILRRKNMRMPLARSGTVCRYALLAAVLVIAVSGCYVYERPAPGYYGGAVVVAPPAPRVIAEPPPRDGYVWVPGYWNWNGNRYVWAGQRWIAARPGYHWVPANWVQVSGGWQFAKGHWEPDAN